MTDISPTALQLLTMAAHAAPPWPTDPAGRQTWLDDVAAMAVQLYRTAAAVDSGIDVLSTCTPITGVIVHVGEVAGRGVITIRPTMGAEADDPSATEDLRTPWLSEPAGARLVEQARSLMGRPCRFGKWYDLVANGPRKGQRVRMCAWIEATGRAQVGAGPTERAAAIQRRLDAIGDRRARTQAKQAFARRFGGAPAQLAPELLGEAEEFVSAPVAMAS